VSRKTRVALIVVGSLFCSVGLVTASPANACANPNVYLSLAGFAPEAGNARLYYGGESDESVAFSVRRLSHDCSFQTASARYTVRHVTTSDADLDPVSGRTIGLRDPDHDSPPHSQPISVPLKNDDTPEAAVEKAVVELSDPEGAVLGTPSSAPLYVVDDDGSSRFSFAEPAYTHDEKMGRLDIPVFRAGDASGAGTIGYEIRGGPSPAATPSEDLTSPASGTVSFAAGQRLRVVSLDVRRDSVSEGNENLTVSLLGEAAADQRETIVTITDDAPVPAPSTRFHHPIQGKRYPYNDYLLREVHVFASDAGAGVARVQIALRRKLDNGACAWWNGSGFTRGACKDKRWFRMKGGDELGDEFFFLYRFPALKRTAGTNIKNYTAYSRAIDPNGVKETHLEKGRNHNTFQVKRR
jgi:hypothetical protein